MGLKFKQPRDKDVILPPKEKVMAHVQKYTKASWFPSIFGYLVTLLPFLGGLYLTKSGLSYVWWPLFALIRVRLFVLFHDMGHLAYFPSTKVNFWIGTLTGTMVWAPFESWRHSHNEHHRNVNNEDKRLYGQTAPWTTQEYLEAPLSQRLAYTLFYGKYTFFPINAYIIFVWIQRAFGTILENTLQFLWIFGIYKTLGWKGVAFDQSTVWIMAMIGAMFSHVEHTFQGAYRRPNKEWDMYASGMLGSSFLQIPIWFQWFTNGLEYHHIHHMNTRVPCYELAKCHDDGKQWFDVVPKVDFGEFVNGMGYSLWDKETREFRDVYDLISL